MIPWYLLGLCIAISGLVVIDYRFKLAFFYNWRQTALTLAIAIGLFVVWDIAGIALGIFFHGGSTWTLPIRLLPEFPIEEVFFLFLLTYVTLVSYRYFKRNIPS